MIKPSIPVLAALLLHLGFAAPAIGQTPTAPQMVEVRSGSLTLRALLWRPQGKGPFPAILLNHGSGRSREELQRLGTYEQQAYVLGPVFARHGYVFFYPFRRGVGLSADQGTNAVDLMNAEFDAHGQDARNSMQLRLLENEEMNDAISALAVLRSMPQVDSHRVAVVGHSFGGSLTLLLAERQPDLRALVIFSGAGYSWDRSAPLRARMTAAVPHIAAPVFFIHAENDFALSAGKAMDAQFAQLHRPHRLQIYPPIGQTVEDGHAFLYLGVSTWEPDVFAFLDEHTQK